MKARPVHTHPSVFMFLIIPFGVVSGYVTVSLAYLMGKSGIPVAQVAALVADSVIPHTWKFAWAPLIDSVLTRKTWYVLASVLSAAGIWALGEVSAGKPEAMEDWRRRVPTCWPSRRMLMAPASWKTSGMRWLT